MSTSKVETASKKKPAAKKPAAATQAAAPSPQAAVKKPKASKPVADQPVAQPKPAKTTKTAKVAKAKPATKAAPAAAKPPKAKLVRDSFTMPRAEYLAIDALKQRSAKAGRPLKKSEVLRAGIKALAAMSDADFMASIASVPVLKTGRPKSKKPSAAAPLE